MRVIAGIAKGKPLVAPPGRLTRPTADRVKEGFFNALGAAVPGSICLDVFAGSGALGIEALSRGAERAVFVERRPEALNALYRNLELTGLASQAEVLKGDAFLQLKKLAAQAGKFTLVLADPPYGEGLAVAALAELEKGNLVQQGGLIVVEAGKREDLPQDFGELQQVRTYFYGDTQIVFYRKIAGKEAK